MDTWKTTTVWQWIYSLVWFATDCADNKYWGVWHGGGTCDCTQPLPPSTYQVFPPLHQMLHIYCLDCCCILGWLCSVPYFSPQACGKLVIVCPHTSHTVVLVSELLVQPVYTESSVLRLFTHCVNEVTAFKGFAQPNVQTCSSTPLQLQAQLVWSRLQCLSLWTREALPEWRNLQTSARRGFHLFLSS